MYPPEIKDRIIELGKEHKLNASEIGAALNANYAFVLTTLRNAGVKAPRKKFSKPENKRTKLILKSIEEIGAMQTAKKFAISKQRVYQILGASGVKLGPRKKQTDNYPIGTEIETQYGKRKVVGVRYSNLVIQCENGHESLINPRNINQCPACRKCEIEEENAKFHGREFEDWTVIGTEPIGGNGHISWLCRCKCGVEKQVLERNLINNLSKSCHKCSLVKRDKVWKEVGLKQFRENRSNAMINHKPGEFGKWTIFSGPYTIGKIKKWECKCACGVTKFVGEQNLLRHVTNQCRECGKKALKKVRNEAKRTGIK